MTKERPQEQLSGEANKEDVAIEPEVLGPAEEIDFDVKFEAGHSYREFWERSDLLCPSCGNKSLWLNPSTEDSYAHSGPTHICTQCDSTFSLTKVHKITNSKYDYSDRQRLAELKKVSKQ